MIVMIFPWDYTLSMSISTLIGGTLTNILEYKLFLTAALPFWKNRSIVLFTNSKLFSLLASIGTTHLDLHVFLEFHSIYNFITILSFRANDEYEVYTLDEIAF